jgi:outer membrane protein assembly factor BamD
LYRFSFESVLKTLPKAAFLRRGAGVTSSLDDELVLIPKGLAMRSLLAVFFILLLVGCSSTKEEAVIPPVEVLYNEGKNFLDEREYKKAIEKFELVEREYPFAEWARRAKLMGAYASYEKGAYTDAEASLEAYVKLYPASEETAYAYYLIALTYYEQITDVRRDQESTRKARQALQDVIRRYPQSDYAKDAKVKLDLVVDHLAGKEMEIGRYYLKRKQFTPAINRFNSVIDNYQTTNHVPEALHRLVECYLALGLAQDAKRTAAVLGYNYPGSDWYADSYRLIEGEGSTPVAVEKTGWWGSVKDSVGKIF